MKLSDVVIGDEYAIHPSRTLQSWNAHPQSAYRARADLHLPGFGASLPARVALVVIGEPAAGRNPYAPAFYPVGSRIELTGPYVWRKWEAHAPLIEEWRARNERREALGQQVRAALGTLGLHDSRGIEIHEAPISSGRALPELTEVELTLSGAELVKLAERAEHLVVLEHLVRRWFDEGSDRGLPADHALYEWAVTHDFSMLDEEPAPTAAEIDAELAAAHPDPDA